MAKSCGLNLLRISNFHFLITLHATQALLQETDWHIKHGSTMYYIRIHVALRTLYHFGKMTLDVVEASIQRLGEGINAWVFIDVLVVDWRVREATEKFGKLCR